VGLSARTSPQALRTNNAPKVRFFATLGEEPEIDVGLHLRLGARALLTELGTSIRVLEGSASGWRTLQRKESYVVLLFPAFPNKGVELLQEEVS
jgi:hypothetical protein